MKMIHLKKCRFHKISYIRVFFLLTLGVLTIKETDVKT